MALSPDARTLLENQTTQFQSNLYEAGEYLANRGITEDTAVSARLGVVDEPVHGDGGAAHNRLAIPSLTRSGVVDIRYRCIRDHDCSEANCPKYLGRPGASLRIYGVDALVRAGQSIAVTEGEFDSLILNQLGYDAVGLPGAESWKRHWRRLFEDFSRIVVFGDGDSAGRRFIKKWMDEFPQAVEGVQLDDGEDVNSMFLKEGEQYFSDILG